jgi:hypothetical protein
MNIPEQPPRQQRIFMLDLDTIEPEHLEEPAASSASDAKRNSSP